MDQIKLQDGGWDYARLSRPQKSSKAKDKGKFGGLVQHQIASALLRCAQSANAIFVR
jgi:hypothetical protein